MDIDCNDCANINITEEEQRKLKNNIQGYRCEFYNSWVIHRSNTKNHNPKLHPCTECTSDNYINFK